MKAKFYVAAPSSNLQRYRDFVGQMRERGMQITHDWSSSIEEAIRLGKTDSTITREVARRAAFNDAIGVRDCAVLILLAPLAGQVTVGGWAELGIAIGLRAARPNRRPLIVIATAAPPTERQYAIFEELADVVVAGSDAEALIAAERLAVAMECADEHGLSFGPIDLAALVGFDEEGQ